MEDRMLLTSGPTLISILPNDGTVLLPNETLTTAPTQLTYRFLLSANEKLDPTTLAGGIQLERSGGDGVFDANDRAAGYTGNDVAVTPGYIGIDPAQPNQVVMRFSTPLPDDLYQITLVGLGKTPLADTASNAFETGTPPVAGNQTQYFRLQLGPQVLSVVPQPVTRDSTGTLTPANNEVDVYFNEPVQTLPRDPTHVDPNQFNLIYTQNTANANDDKVYVPDSSPTLAGITLESDGRYHVPGSVQYDPLNNEARIIFQQGASSINLDALGGSPGSTTGAFRLRVGNDEIPVTKPVTLPGSGMTDGTFAHATELPVPVGTPPGGLAPPLPAGQQAVVFTGDIEQQSILDGLVFPGGLADPGHRNIPLDENHVGGVYAGSAATLTYSFPVHYGNDPTTGQPLLNQINANEEQTVREIFQLYSYYTGLTFKEATGDGGQDGQDWIVVGDPRVLDPTVPPVGISLGGGQGNPGQPHFGGLEAIINGNSNYGTALYGSGFMSLAMHEIGHTLGLPHDDDGPPDTVMNGGAESQQAGGGAQGLFPGIADITNLQFTNEPTSNQVDLYKFTVDSAGTLNAETQAQRLTTVSQLNTLLTVYEEFNDLSLPASGAQAVDGDTFTITATNKDGTAGTPVTFQFVQLQPNQPSPINPATGLLPNGKAGVGFFSTDTSQDIAVSIVTAIEGQNLNVSATIANGVVQIAGPATVTTTGHVDPTTGNTVSTVTQSLARQEIARNDDYFGNDSLASLAVQPGMYYVAVAASGNDQFDPNVANSGWGGNSRGKYNLSLTFQATPTQPLTDPGLSLFVPANPLDPVSGIPNGYAFTLTDIVKGTSPPTPATETIIFHNDGTSTSGDINVQLTAGDTQQSVTTKLVAALNQAVTAGGFDPAHYNLSDIGDGRIEVGGAPTTSLVVDPLEIANPNAVGNLTGTSSDKFPLVLWGTTSRDPLVGNSNPDGSGAYNFWFNVGPSDAAKPGHTVYVDKAAPTGGNGNGPLGSATNPYNTIQAALNDSSVVGAPALGQQVNLRVEPNAHATLAVAASQNGIAVGQTFQVLAGPYTFNFEFTASGTPGQSISTGDSNLAVVIGNAPNPPSANVALAIENALKAATITLASGRVVSLTAADGGDVTVTHGIEGTASSYTDGNYYYVYLFQGAQPITVNTQATPTSPKTPFSKTIPSVTPPTINNNNLSYLVGTDQFGRLLPDDSPSNSILQLPKNTVLMVDAGAVFKLRQSNIEAGSSAVNIDQSQSALQVLGIPGEHPIFTSYNDDTPSLGVPQVHPGVAAAPGDWGGLVFNNDSDLESLGVFLNAIDEATIEYGGGRVVVNGVPGNYDSIYLATARPAITNNLVVNGAGAAISANPDSFQSSHFTNDLAITISEIPGPAPNGYTFTIDGTTFEFTSNGVVSSSNNVPISFAGVSDPRQLAQRVSEVINATLYGSAVNRAEVIGNVVTLPGNHDTTSPGGNRAVGSIVNFSTDGYSTDYQRSGPDVYGNLLTTGASNSAPVFNPNNPGQQIGVTFTGLAQDTVNGILVRINTQAGASIDTLDVSAVFAATDIPYVLQENLIITGNTGGNTQKLVGGVPVTTARIAGQLLVEPGVLVKLGGSRIEAQSGANVIAEGTAAEPIVFTSINDARYGGGGTFDTANSGATVAPRPGDWAGFYFWPTSSGSIDQSLITFGGGSAAIEGGFASFDAVEIHQAKVRIADSTLENNFGGTAMPNGDRNGRLTNANATIFVLGAQPVIVNNVIQNNEADAISIDVDSLDSNQVPDWGRSTGPLDAFTQFNDNYGPLVRLNKIGSNFTNGMVVRGGTLETSSIWDDTDIVHVVVGTVTVPNFQSVGGLRLESSATQSLVVKMAGKAGFDASGTPGDVSDRIGGEIQILGTPNHPVKITSLKDDTVGAGLTPSDQADNDTNGDGSQSTPSPGDWNSILIEQYSNDRNVAMVNQSTAGATPAAAQSLGQLAPNQQSGDDNLRLGFQVNGQLGTTQEIDTYTFKAAAGTQTFISVTNTSPALDAVVELLDANGNVLARSDQANAEQQDAASNGDPLQSGSLLSSALPGNLAQPLQESTTGVAGLGLEDYWSTNPLDPGFRVTLPGAVGSTNNYYVRVYAKGPSGPPPATNTAFDATGTTLSAPTLAVINPATDVSASGGGLLSAKYYYEVTATTATGETLPSGQEAASVTGPTGSVTLNWSPVAGATGYKIYRSTLPFGTLPGQQYYDLVAVVPGQSAKTYTDTGVNLTYLPDTATPGAVSHGLTGGQYELQIRLQQMVEVPGSTVQNADIRFATNGIDVEGQPGHSPLIVNTSVGAGVDTTQPGSNPGTGVPAQNLGDLLTTDTSSLNAAGYLSNLDAVQWYKFNLTYAQIQSIGGFTNGAKTWSTVFDVGYADGLTRPDTEIDVYDSAGNLIYVGRDSNVADQQPPPAATGLGGDAGNLSHSSFGQNDPYIGPVQMAVGAAQTYYVAVHSSAVLPSALDATFNGTATDYMVRLEPVDSLNRVVEDHIGTQGGSTAQDPNTLSPLFGSATGTSGAANPAGAYTVDNTGAKVSTLGYQQLNSYATPFNLADTVLYVTGTGTDGTTHLFTYNPFTGIVETDQGSIANQSASGFGMNAIAMRNDGQLYGMETGKGDGNTNLVQINTGNPSLSTIAGNAAIATFYYPPPNFSWASADAGVQFDAMTFVQSQGNSKITEPNGANDRLLFAIGHRDPRSGNGFNGDGVAPQPNMLYELNANTGNSSGFVIPNAKNISENPLPTSPTSFSTSPIVYVTNATDLNGNVAEDIVDSTWWGPGAAARGDGTNINQPPNANTATLPAPLQGIPLATSGGLLPVGTYYYKVTATNTVGETVGSNEQLVDTAAPIQSPAVPSATGGTLGGATTTTYDYVVTALTDAGETSVVTALGTSNEQSATVTGPTGSVALSWTQQPGAVGYRIYRGTSAGGENFLVGTVVGGGVTTFTDTGALATLQTPSFSANAQVTLNWATVPGAKGYNVYRGISPTALNALLNPTPLSATTTNFTDTGAATSAFSPPTTNGAKISAPALTGLTPAAAGGSLTTNTYDYVVTANTPNGETMASSSLPMAVTGPNGEVTVKWKGVAGATSYNVYRGTSPGSENYMVGTVPASYDANGNALSGTFVDTFNGPTRVTVTPKFGSPTTFEMDSGPEIDFYTDPNTFNTINNAGGTGLTVANGGGAVMTTAASFRAGEQFQLQDPVTGAAKTFFFQNTGAVLPFFAANGVSAGGANTVHEHEYFTLTGSKGTATFEFVFGGDPTFQAGAIPIRVTAGQTVDGVVGDIALAINGSGINVTAVQPQLGDNRIELTGLAVNGNSFIFAPNEFPYGLAPVLATPGGDVAINFSEADPLPTLEAEIATAVNGAFGGDITATISNDLSFINSSGKPQAYGSRMAFLVTDTTHGALDGKPELISPTALTSGMVDPLSDPGSTGQATGFTYVVGSDNGVNWYQTGSVSKANDVRVPFHLNDPADFAELPAPLGASFTGIDEELLTAINNVFPGMASPASDAPAFTKFGVQLSNTVSSGDSTTLPFTIPPGTGGNGGNITGLAAIDNGSNTPPLYAVTDQGSLYQINYSADPPGLYNPDAASLTFIANLVDPTTGQAIAFHGMTVGPPDVENGAYANLLFATSESGVLYAFDPTGPVVNGDLALAPVFHDPTLADATERQGYIKLAGISGGNTFGTTAGASLNLYNNVSLAFSTVDYNLWHVTNTNQDPNQGINVAPDKSRNSLSPNKPPAAGNSFYFGLEAHSDTANTPQNALPLDSTYYKTATYDGGNAPYNSYDVPGGAYGSLTTNTFSLGGYNAGEKPTLYFDYYLDAGGNYAVKNTSPQPFSSARVFVSPDGGQTWQLLATNDTVLADAPKDGAGGTKILDKTTQMPSYVSTSEDTGSGDPRQQVQPLWDSMSTNSAWRQARIDLSNYVGDTNLELRFDFSSSGSTYNPSSPGNYIQGKENKSAGVDSLAYDNSFGANYDDGAQPNSRAGIGQNLNHAGWYVDDIIVGFAGQGEMVTNAAMLGGAANTSYFQVPQNPDAAAVKQILSGPYELEIRRGAEFGENVNNVISDIALYQTFSINDRLDSSFSLNTDFTETPTGADATITPSLVSFAFGAGTTDSPTLIPTLDGQGELTLSMNVQMTADPKITNLAVAPQFTVSIPQLSGALGFLQTITGNRAYGANPAAGQPQGQIVTASYTLSAAQMTALTALGGFTVKVSADQNVEDEAGHLGIVSASATLDYMPLAEHQQFMIDDGKNKLTFEFVRNGDAAATGNVPIKYPVNAAFDPMSLAFQSLPQQMASAILMAINSVFNVNTFNVSASESGSGDNNSAGMIDLFGAQNLINGGANLTPPATAPQYGVTNKMYANYFAGYAGTTLFSNLNFPLPPAGEPNDSFVTQYDVGLTDQYTPNFGGTTMPRPQGAVILYGNQISNSQDSGILVEASPRGQLVGPQVIFSGGGGSGAAGTATVNAAGQITGIVITNGGSGYTSPPLVSVAGGGNGAVLGPAVLNNGAVQSVFVSFGGANYINGDNNASFPHQGALLNGPTLDSDLLAPGVTIINNLIYGVSATGSGIMFAGDPDQSGPLAAVPFGRIVNNTIYGGYTQTVNKVTTPVGVGINVADNASPTMLNNILANLNTGIYAAPSNALADILSPPVLGENLFQNDTTSSNLGDGANALELQPSDPLFIKPTTDPGTANFYLKEGSQAIDSSINSLLDRAEMTAVTGPLGIAPSPIIAPSVDLYGQLRVPDPNVSPFPGLGNNVFIDRGAIERVDNPSVGLTASLLTPVDNGPGDLSPSSNTVFIRNQLLNEFTIEFSDGTGPGVYDASVLASRLDVVEDGRLLTQGVDYFFHYDNNNHIIHLLAASGVWLNGHEYDIYLSNGNNGGVFDPFNPTSTPGPVQDLAFNNLQANEASGYTHFRIDLAFTGNTPPVVELPTPSQIDAAYDATLPTGAPIPPDLVGPISSTSSIYEHTSITYSAAGGDPITIYDVDANGGTETVTLTVNTGTLTLNPLAKSAFEAAGYTDTGNGTNTVTLTAPLGDPNTVPVTQGINTVLDGLTFTPADTFPQDAIALQPGAAASGTATLTITVNDQGHSPPPAQVNAVTTSVNVIAVNDPPADNVPASSDPTVNPSPGPIPTGEDVPVVFNGSPTAIDPLARPLALTVTDPDITTTGPDYDNPSFIYQEQVQLALANAGMLTLGAGLTELTTVTGNGSASINMTGTLKAINDALNGLIFTENKEYTGAATITLSTNDNGNIGVGPAPGYAPPPVPLTASSVIYLTVKPDNDYPTFTPASGAPQNLAFTAIPEDTTAATDTPTSVKAMLQSLPAADGGTGSESDVITLHAKEAVAAQSYGIAVIGAGPAADGTWYYSLDGGATWNSLAGASATSPVLLDQSDLIEFVPTAEFRTTGTGAQAAPTLQFLAWDETYDFATGGVDKPGPLAVDLTQAANTGGTTPFSPYSASASQIATASIQVTAVNDAPSLLATSGMGITLNEDAGLSDQLATNPNPGTTITAMLSSTKTTGGLPSDVIKLNAPGATYGIAIVGYDTQGEGQFNYSIDGGATFRPLPAGTNASAALLLGPNDLLQFVPVEEYNTTASPPKPFVSFVAWDGTADPLGRNDTHGQQVDLTATNGTGLSTPYSPITFTGSPPVPSAADVAEATVTVTPDYDAPTINPTSIPLPGINEDAGLPNQPANGGFIIKQALSSYLTFPATATDANAKPGIAVTSVDTSNGNWQVSLDGGKNWFNIDPATTAATALLLDGGDSLRFLPNEEFSRTAQIKFVAWDQTIDAFTGGTDPSTTVIGGILVPHTVNLAKTGTGGSTPFSAQTATGTLTVAAVNDSPLLNVSTGVSFQAINEDPTSNPGSTVLKMLESLTGGTGSAADVINLRTAAEGGKYGIAVVGAGQTGNGKWQYSTDGTNWQDFPAVSPSSALLLDSSELVRFVPNANFNSTALNQSVWGGAPSLSFVAWDETYDAATGGVDAPSSFGAPKQVNLTGANATGGSTPFSSPASPATATLTVNAVDDAPVVTVGTPSFAVDEVVNTGDTTPNVTISGLTVSDVDAAEASTGTNTQEKLTVSVPAGVGTIAMAGQSGVTTIAVTNTLANLNTDLAGLVFTPAKESAPGTTLTVTIDDLGNFGTLPPGQTSLTATGTVSITINPVHHAPVLTASPETVSILEKVHAGDTQTNPGQQISALLSLPTPDVTLDTDKNARYGIAVTGTSLQYPLTGSWQYSPDGGPNNWTPFPAVSPNSALLVPGSYYVKFVSDAGTAGLATLQFQAWDQTDGKTAASTVDLSNSSSAGGTTAYSTSSGTIGWNVQLVNQPPTFTVPNGETTLENNTVLLSGGKAGGSDPGPDVIKGFASQISAGQAIEDDPNSPFHQLVNFTVTQTNNAVTPSTNALFSLAPYIVGTDPSDPMKAAYPSLKPGDLIYALSPDVFGSTTLSIVATDNGGTANGGTNTSSTINVPFTVTQINDPPTIDPVAPVTMLENAPAKTINLTNITAGLNEPNQKIVSITATSDNHTLLPDPTISYTSGAAAATLTLQPKAFESGKANVTITLVDNGDTSNSGTNTFSETFPVNVLFVNDAPSFTIGNDQTIDEDAPAQIVPNFVPSTSISAGRGNLDTVPPNNTLSFLISTSNDNLFSSLPQIDPATGTLTYAVAPNTSGTATVTVRLHDSGGTANGGVDTSAQQQFKITVDFVNDAPTFVPAASVPAVNEDSGQQTFQWATSISPSGTFPAEANEAGQSVNFQIISNDNPGLFLSGPFVSSTGLLTYTPVPNASGVANLMVNLHDSGGTTNGGVDTSPAVPLQINVNFVNDAPSFQYQSGSQVVNEDSGFHAVPNFITNISPGDGANESTQHVKFNVSNDAPAAMFSVPPQIVVSGTTGTLQYTLAPLQATLPNQPIHITVQAQDDGGTANGGVDSSAPATVQLFVTPVEHAPTLASPNPLSTVTVNENAADQVFGNLANIFNDVDIPYGDHLSLSLAGNSNPGLLSASLSSADPATGLLTLHFLADQFGKSTLDLRATDSHGKSVDDLIDVIVNLVNHAPSFTAGPDVRVDNSAGPQSIAGWASNISAGPASEAGQKLTFNVTGDTNSSLFAVKPAVDPTTGTLTFTPNATAFGTAAITLSLHDDGGTANGGQDTSASQIFNITLNAGPVAKDVSYTLSIGNSSSATASDGVLANTSDPDGDLVTAKIVSQPTYGTVSLNADGSFTYTKGPGFAGIDSFTFQASDGSLTSNTATVNIISYEASIVKKLYEQVLGRDPDTSGLQFWTTQIEQGKPYSVIAQGIFESDERLNPIITNYYKQFLFRAPDAEGLAYWRDNVWKVYGGPERVIAGMMSSPEFYASAGGTNTGWVKALYERLLNRQFDAQGLNYWVNLLDTKQQTEFQVVMGFLTSDENYKLLTNTFFQEYLQRQPSPTELNDYVAAFRAGASQRDIQIKIIDTQEYRNTPPPPSPGTVRLIS